MNNTTAILNVLSETLKPMGYIPDRVPEELKSLNQHRPDSPTQLRKKNLEAHKKGIKNHG